MKLENLTQLTEISNGNERAFEEIYRQYFSQSFDTALYITKSKYLAEETVSDVFATIWKERTKLTAIKDWESYLFIITRNRAFYYRKKTSTRKTESPEDLPYHISFDKSNSPLDDLQLKELTLKVEQELNKLPEKMKLVFYMVKEKKLSHKEIAKHFNLSERTINAHITEASKRLREAITKFLRGDQ